MFAAILTLGIVLDQAPADAKTYRLQATQIMDLAGGSGFPAYNLLAPKGWSQTQGGVQWGQNCEPFGFVLQWALRAPDRSQSILIQPAHDFGFPLALNCPAQRPYKNVADLLRDQVNSMGRDARIGRFTPRPDLAGHALPTVRQPNSVFAPFDMAGQIEFELTDSIGQRVRGIAVGRLAGARTYTPGYEGVAGLDSTVGISDPTFVYIARPDRFDPRLAEMIRKSLVPDPVWAKRIHTHMAKVNGINLKAMEKRLRDRAAFMRANAGVFTAAATRSTNGRWLDRERTEAIRGVETYVDARGREVQLDNTYPHAWDLGPDGYLVTSDPSFDPRVGTTLRGARMRVAP